MDYLKPYVVPTSRFALAFIYIWFGWPKLFGLSPADPVVNALLEKTLPFISFDFFILFLGVVEVVIGILWLIPKATKPVFWIMMGHMFTTFGVLVFTINEAWKIPFVVATLEGQYILKNVALVACAIAIAASYKKKA